MTPEILKNISIELLCETWEKVDEFEVTVEMARVRGWVLDELGRRNIEALDKWSDDEIEIGHSLPPLKYFV